MARDRKKKSRLWFVETSRLVEVVAEAKTFSGILRTLEHRPDGDAVRILKQRLDSEKIDYTHVNQGLGSRPSAEGHWRFIPLKRLLKRGVRSGRGHIKQKLIREGLLQNKCAVCGQGPVWCGKPLVLVLDHINGKNDDYRITNLRLLCPNCNSQTETFAGRNTRRARGKEPRCRDCGRCVTKRSVRCLSCSNKKRRGVSKIPGFKWPYPSVLDKMVRASNMSQVARKLGVSISAVRRKMGKF